MNRRKSTALERLETRNVRAEVGRNGNRINYVATFGGAKHVYDNESLMLERSTYVTNCWISSIEILTIVYPDRSASESSVVTFFSLTRFSPVYFYKEDEIAFMENAQGNQLSNGSLSRKERYGKHAVNDSEVNYHLTERKSTYIKCNRE